MNKQWSRVVQPKHEYEIKVDLSNDNETMQRVAKNLVFAPHVSKISRRLGIPISTVHDNIRRIDSRYELIVQVKIAKKVKQ